MIFVLASVVAIAAAARSTWSPCGLSMLSTVTPIAEQGRGHRYPVTAAWFIAGAVLGGATLGLAAALLAAGLGVTGLTTSAALALVAVAALTGAVSDLHPFGRHLPIHRRQVNEDWLTQFRPWVYGAGFGWQIGVGLATFIVTAAVYVMIVLAALTTSPVAAFTVCLVFGTTRGLAVLLGARLTTTAKLMAFHRWFDAVGEPTRQFTIAVQFVVAGGAVVALWAPAAAITLALTIAVALGIGYALSTRRAQPVPAVVTPGRSPNR